MALYSVWDWDRNARAVYRDSRTVSVGDDPKPPKPARVSAIGADPDTQLNPLPPGARFVGFDHMCRGEARVRPDGMLTSALSGLGFEMPSEDDFKKYAAGAALGALAIWYWKGRRS